MARLLVVFIFFMWVLTSCHAGKDKQEKGARKKKVKDNKFDPYLLTSLSMWIDLGAAKLRGACQQAGLPETGSITSLAMRLFQYYYPMSTSEQVAATETIHGRVLFAMQGSSGGESACQSSATITSAPCSNSGGVDTSSSSVDNVDFLNVGSNNNDQVTNDLADITPFDVHGTLSRYLGGEGGAGAEGDLFSGSVLGGLVDNQISGPSSQIDTNNGGARPRTVQQESPQRQQSVLYNINQFECPHTNHEFGR